MNKQTLKAGFVLKALAITMFVIVSAVQAFAQNWVEQRTYVSGGKAAPRIAGLLTRPVKGSLGSFVWFQVQEGYSQAYAGATYSPKPWVQFALGGGMEEARHPARLGSYVWAGKGLVTGLAVFEQGGSGFWWKVETNYQVRSALGIGTLSEAYKGTGPKLELSVPHTRLKLWVAPLWKHGSISPLIGVRCSL